MNVDALHEAVLTWGERVRRDLPWRRTRDPWAILVSELMLQQTQVPRVVPKFEAFMERFPTAIACASAPLASVIDAWAGLGYNRRAVNLHRAAVLVTENHGGQLPRDLDGLLELPGIGPYTARAVLVFAHEDDVGVVDTNVSRLLARWLGRPLGQAEAQSLADCFVPEGRAWSWNQALFDLGSSSCRARAIDCDSCCVRSLCSWRGEGADPAQAPSRQSTFAGSDRQGRGRLVDALRAGRVRDAELAATMGWPDEPGRATRVAQGLAADGLARCVDGCWELPA